MSGFRPWCVVCEGKSEVSYLANLARFLRSEMDARGLFVPPVSFVGKPPVHGVGTGRCETVKTAFEKERTGNRRASFRIWVDADLFVREETNDPASFSRHRAVFLGTSRRLPAFSFSSLNFEDFLALHFDDGLYEDWKRTFSAKGHFLHPLHGRDYLPLFRPFWRQFIGETAPAYEKGDIPDGTITERSLANLFRHCGDPDVVSAVRNITSEPTFAEFLRHEILAAFPDLES